MIMRAVRELPPGTIVVCLLAGGFAAVTLTSCALDAPRWLTLSLGAMAGLVVATIMVTVLAAVTLYKRAAQEKTDEDE